MIGNSVMALLAKISPVLIVLLVILGVLIIVLVVLSIIGKRVQKKQAENEAAMQQSSQVISMLVIDKKRLKLKEAGLPNIVVEQTPKYLRGSKVPIVKAKVGPKIMSMMCDQKVYDQIPVKKEIKAVVSGIYIMGIKGSRNGPEPVENLGRFAKLRKKAMDALNSRKKK